MKLKKQKKAFPFRGMCYTVCEVIIMSIRIEPFGEDAHLYTLENSAGTRLVLTEIGAAAISLVYRGRDILLGWDNPGRYFNGDGDLGATVGRVANRVADACFSLNGRTFTLAKNDGENNLHSGPNGYHNRRWQVADTADDRVVFCMDSPDGDQGFPGRLRLWASYTLTGDDTVQLDYRGEADADTPVNVTNHSYFNLNGHDSGSILGHTLRLNADSFTPCRTGLIPTGEILSVADTPFDFRDPHPIGERIDEDDPRLASAGGYDLNFALNGEGLRPAAELTGEKSGVRLTVLTDAPGVQLYSGNFLMGETGKNGAVYARRTGVCLETQGFPNAVNEPRFPSVVLKRGEVYRTRTVWQLSQI